MAASSGWRFRLNQHKIFSILGEDRCTTDTGIDSKDLIAVKDGELFVWNSYNQSLLTTNLKNLVAGDDGANRRPYQLIRCSDPPVYDVVSIQFNSTGSHLALIGKKGLSVLHLPQRWGKYAEFEGGKEKILAKNTPIAERYFLTTNEGILHASWHPGSSMDSHLMILTSDNYIRIFNLSDPDNADQSFPLSCNGSSSTSGLSIREALGDSAVSFDYGPPVELRRKVELLRGNKQSDTRSEYAWPVYILWGNGEVYMLMTKINNQYPLKCCVRGPLSMYPPADDNYGTDACSIVCLPSRPPVLAVATCEGKIHNCIVLNRGEVDGNEAQTEWAEMETGVLYHPIPDPSLYVYESIELELSLSTPSLDSNEPTEDDFTCPIRLHKDPGHSDRFHCSHAAGVHALVFPWIHKFQSFCDDGNMDSELPTLSPEQQAIVEHIICTKPIASSPPSPVLGLALVSDRLLGPTLVCLTATFECITLPLLHNTRSSAPPLLSASPLKKIQSPMKKLHKEPFDMHVQKILQRNVSNPILRSDRNVDLTPQECFQLLSRATQVFREQYIQKQEQAREEIQRRIRVLKDQKEQQLSDLRECQQAKNILTNNAGDLAEKYEEANDRHQAVVDRLETILKKLQSRLPMLSDSEKNMQKELKELAQRLKVYKEKLKQLKVKKQYQDRQISSHGSNAGAQSTSFTPTQTKQLRSVLKEEGDDISDLVKQVNQLKMNIET